MLNTFVFAFVLAILSVFPAKADIFIFANDGLCETPLFNQLIHQQPQSMQGFLLVTKPQKNTLKNQCNEQTSFSLGKELSYYLIEHDILNGLNEWGTQSNEDKLTVVKKLAAFDSNMTQQQALAIKILHMAMLYESFSFPQAINIADEIIEQHPKTLSEIAALITKAEALVRQNKFEESKVILDRVKSKKIKEIRTSIISANYSNSLMTRTYYLLAEIHLILGNTGEALSNLELAQHMIDSFNNIDIRDQITVNDNWGFYYVRMSNYQPELRLTHLLMAIEKEYMALRIAAEHNAYRQLIVIHNNIAWMYHSLHALDSAQRNHLIALDWLQKYPDRERETLIFTGLGRIYQTLGEYSRAKNYLLQAREYATNNAPNVQAELNCSLAESAVSASKIGDAQKHLAQCKAHFDDQENVSNERLRILLIESKINPKEARVNSANFQSIVTLLEQASSFKIKGEAYLFLASKADPKDALILFDKAFEAVSQSANLPALFDAYAQAFHKTQSTSNLRAITKQYGEQAIGILQQILRQVEPTEIGSAWVSKVQVFYSTYINYVLAIEQNPRKAMQLTLTLKHINARSSLSLIGDNNDQQRKFANQLAEDAFNALLQVNKSPQKEFAKAINKDLFYLHYQGSSENLSVSELDLYERKKGTLRFEDFSTSLEDNKLLNLQAGAAVLAFVNINDQLGLFVQDKKEVRYFSIAKTERIKTHVRNVFEALKNRQPNVYRLVNNLQQVLIPAPIKEANYKHFTLYSEMGIHQIPFALMLPNAKSITRKLSLTQITKKNESLNSLALFALSEKPNDLLLSQSPQINDLPPLPMTKVEVVKIGNSFQGNNISFMNQEATKQNILSAAVRNSDILHIGLHHIFNPKRPLDLGLLLVPNRKTNKMSDAFLSTTEISYSDFNNQLVFLNGCETYRGKVYAGEGVMGVSRAFLNAGSKRVVSTLWPVSDRASAIFTKHYYDSYFRHFDASLALSEAQKKMSKNLRYRHPYYWAGYTLTEQ